jgi:hypothetical protein
MAEFIGSLFGGEKDQAPVVASDDGMFKFLTPAIPSEGRCRSTLQFAVGFVSCIAIWP